MHFKAEKGAWFKMCKDHKNAEDVNCLKHVLADSANDYILQNKIEGVEYIVQIAADKHGKLVAVVPVRVHVKHGITIAAEVHNSANVIAACWQIHDSILAFGCYNIQLVLTDEKNVMPFEINPRISTTFCLVIAAGVDPITIYAGKIKYDSLISFLDGTQLRRYWINHFSSIKKR